MCLSTEVGKVAIDIAWTKMEILPLLQTLQVLTSVGYSCFKSGHKSLQPSVKLRQPPNTPILVIAFSTVVASNVKHA